jgi:double-stranded uracil-DNA glycosylase
LRARTALGLEQLGPENDAALPHFGIGFTDVVKRPTARASDVATAEFVAGAAVLLKKLTRYRPRVACFHGVTGYRHVQRVLAGADAPAIALGLQDLRVGATRVFVVPNPSGANAHYTRAEQTRWYDALAALVQ